MGSSDAIIALIGLSALWDWLDQGHLEAIKENAVLEGEDLDDLEGDRDAPF